MASQRKRSKGDDERGDGSGLTKEKEKKIFFCWSQREIGASKVFKNALFLSLLWLKFRSKFQYAQSSISSTR